ncbi:uncharacterized protein GGS25DRAFT_498364 [Hypoxylon fragiforme]|uniref:uncharacterized protein n=1 Tax=Hypoxylon fragiforme TaxID=63214 RepID=UPI0020C73FDA|nr:uncharacterized protein GGS25DRAFT_498364 [Hypoxylon fragiforme]KAI2605866.1 hypothetical protein GGS25DRAFT_498364 [Hypoxylon fragiforme]
MGFTTGFTGGVTLTLSIAYLTVLTHQRNREYQAAILRQQTRALSGIIDPLPPALPPTRAELAAAQRANFVERAKDRWNAEVEGAVHWAQNKDWYEARHDLEAAAARLWARALSSSSSDDKNVRAEAEGKAQEIVARARDQTISSQAGSVAAASGNSLKAQGIEAANKAEGEAKAAKGSIFGAIGGFFSRGKQMLVGASEEEKASNVLLSPEEKALQKRYQQGASGMNRSTEEVLAERYGSAKQ